MAKSSIKKLCRTNSGRPIENHFAEEWIELAGCLSERVVLPSGIYVEYLPPYSPEQQRAERLWSVADEPKRQ